LDVSVIIVNYNTISLLVDAIDSVFEKTEGVEYEIIVVDNASSDNSKNILADKYGDKITYLALPENIGFGRANNEAAKIAKGRNLFFLNPDTILLNNAVKILSDYLDNNHRVGCCGGNLYDTDGKPTHSFDRYFTPLLKYFINQLFYGIFSKIFFRKNIHYNYLYKPLKVKVIIGADLMIKKKLFNKLHGFDPDFFMYHEEAELEYRIIKEGYKVFNVPHAKIIHLEGKSFSNNSDKINKIVISYKIFLKKTTNQVTLFIIYILIYFLIISRIIVFSILQKNEKIITWTRRYKTYIEKKDIIDSIYEYIRSCFIEIK